MTPNTNLTDGLPDDEAMRKHTTENIGCSLCAEFVAARNNYFWGAQWMRSLARTLIDAKDAEITQWRKLERLVDIALEGRDLADARIKELEECAENARAARAPRPGDFNYVVSYGGGVGPDVWDNEITISAVDINDAISQSAALMDECGGWVFMVSQEDYPPTTRETLEKERDSLRAELASLKSCNHSYPVGQCEACNKSGYDLNRGCPICENKALRAELEALRAAKHDRDEIGRLRNALQVTVVALDQSFGRLDQVKRQALLTLKGSAEPPSVTISEQPTQEPCVPTGKRYSSVNELVNELSQEVQDEYYRLKTAEDASPSASPIPAEAVEAYEAVYQNLLSKGPSEVLQIIAKACEDYHGRMSRKTPPSEWKQGHDR